MPYDRYEKLPSFTESLLPCLLTGSARVPQILACTQSDNANTSQCVWQTSPSKMSSYSDIRGTSHTYTGSHEMACPFDMLNSQHIETEQKIDTEIENLNASIYNSQQTNLCEDDYFSTERDLDSGNRRSSKSESPYANMDIHCPNMGCNDGILQCQNDDAFVCGDKDNCRQSKDPLKEYDQSLADKVEQELGVGKKPRLENASHCSATSLESSGKRNAWGRLSYADLIRRAIESSPDKRLTLAQIYEWMVCYVPYFRDKGDKKSSVGWKNSVRHNLSLHDQFVRIRESDSSKISWWTINANVPRQTSSCDQQESQQRQQIGSANCALSGKDGQIFKTSNAGRKRKKKIMSTLAALEGQLHMALSKKQRGQNGDRDARTLSEDFFDVTCKEGRQTASTDSRQVNLPPVTCYDAFTTYPMLHQAASQQTEPGYPMGAKDCSVNSCQQNYDHADNQYIRSACGGNTHNEHPAELNYLSSNDITKGSIAISDCNDHQQLESATLLLSAACSLMNGNSGGQRLANQANVTTSNSAQKEVNHTILSDQGKYEDYSPRDAVLLLQLTNGELCQVLPSGEIDFTDNDMSTNYIMQTSVNQNVGDR